MHFTADEGWLNDPLSPTFDGQRYHLYFQHVPGATSWAPECHWGHAVSEDLLTWEQRPDALVPGDGDGGVWSGSIVARPGGGHRAFYTAVDVDAPAVGRVRVADCDDLAGSDHDDADAGWVKGEVVVRAPDGLDISSFRDPFVERVADGWRMLLAASLAAEVAAVLTYSSPDLDEWTYDGVAISRSSAEHDPLWSGSLWECPQLVTVEGTDVLVASVWHEDVLHHVLAAPVERIAETLEPVSWQQLTAGAGYYAPVAFVDADGEPCIMFWIRGHLDEDAARAGMLSLPHRLHLLDGRLVLGLHPAVERRLSAHRGESNAAVLGPIDLRAGAVEIAGVVRLELADEGVVVIEVGGETTRLDASPDAIQVVLDGPCVEVLTAGACFAADVGAVHWPDVVAGARMRWIS